MRNNFMINQTEEAEFPKGFNGSLQDGFIADMNYALPQFVEIFEKSLHKMLNEVERIDPSFLNRNSKPNRMNENIKGFLSKIFPDKIKENGSKRFYFLEKDGYILLFKKLNRDYLPSNIKTKSSKSILNQSALDLPELPIIFVGYTPNSSWEKIDRISAVYISGNEVVWKVDLRRYENEGRNFELFGVKKDVQEFPSLLVKPKNQGKTSEQK